MSCDCKNKLVTVEVPPSRYIEVVQSRASTWQQRMPLFLDAGEGRDSLCWEPRLRYAAFQITDGTDLETATALVEISTYPIGRELFGTPVGALTPLFGCRFPIVPAQQTSSLYVAADSPAGIDLPVSPWTAYALFCRVDQGARTDEWSLTARIDWALRSDYCQRPLEGR